MSEVTNVTEWSFTISDIIALASAVIAIISIIISIVAMKQTTNINKTNLQAEYFQKIFFDFIVERIPEKARELRYVNERLDDNYRQLINVVMEMFQKSKFFSYSKNEFYLELKRACEDFEDVVLNVAAHRTSVRAEQDENLVKIHEELQKIVGLINKYYYKF